MVIRYLTLAALVTLLSCSTGSNHSLTVTGDDERMAFAAAEIERAIAALDSPGFAYDIHLEATNLGAPTASRQPADTEGFRLSVVGSTITVAGTDPAGVMYGGLELAELIRIGADLSTLSPIEQQPYLKRRGVKFNIPLDLRTPSYTDASDAGQENIDDVWDMDFWEDYLDDLARKRFNYVSLWNLHPFPSLIKVPDYPDVALADVQRSTANWKENYALQATNLDEPDLMEDPEIVRQMTIEEKIDFWRRVMRYGKSRNIDFHLITWNIFTYGTEGKYGITDAIDDETTRDYFRKSVTQCFLTYPDLAGIGLTTGENMPRQSTAAKEEWAYATYAEGVLAAAEQLPDRRITFIHRQHQTGAADIAERFRTLIDHPNIDFLFCFKYAKAHSMSATEQPYHQGFVSDIAGLKTLWGLRNDSNYHFRWAAPDFVRAFIKNLPTDVGEGIYYGADQWVQGRDFLMKSPDLAGQLEIEKNWLHWALWGRLSYDPTVSNDRFAALVEARFPSVNGADLLAAWQSASMIYPTVNGLHWGVLDFKWFPEACLSRPGPARNETGFHDVNRFISLPPHPMAGVQSIRDFADGKEADGKQSPAQVAEQLRAFSEQARIGIDEMFPTGYSELEATLLDIYTMADLGDYYAHKIDGSVAVAAYRLTGEMDRKTAAIQSLEKARDHWERYISSAERQYRNPLWTNRVGHVDWSEISNWVAADIEIARSAEVGVDPTRDH